MAQPVLVTGAASRMAKKNEELSRSARSCICLAVVLCTTSVVVLATQLIAQVASFDLAKMPAIGTVDERFQSYNIEMVDVIGGRFWKSYGSTTNKNIRVDPGHEKILDTVYLLLIYRWWTYSCLQPIAFQMICSTCSP
jgi:hypothetical protein